MKCILHVLAVATLLAGGARQLKGQEGANAGSPGWNAPSSVSAGTRFIIGLRDNLSTKDARSGDRFRARTLEPLLTTSGGVLSPGMEIRGHIDKVDAAHKTGRGRLWLTFDEVRTRAGWTPLIADLVDIPGVHSVKVDYDGEGEIEARTSKHQREAEAAAAGALVGAAGGVAARSGRDAAMGAAVGAATAFMSASGLGEELTLTKDTKLEIILDRPLYLSRF